MADYTTAISQVDASAHAVSEVSESAHALSELEESDDDDGPEIPVS